MKVVVIDIGGSNVKIYRPGQSLPVKIPSGPHLTPKQFVKNVQSAMDKWNYDVISIGYPGPVADGKPTRDPFNLGKGWVGFNFQKAFRHPVKVTNDAAMQALGSYRGGRMLFLGVGTGLGSALIIDGAIQPMELAHLPYKRKTFEDYVGEAARKRLGQKKWSQKVFDVVGQLKNGLQAEYVVLGGGNAKRLKSLPPDTFRGDNKDARVGGLRLWRGFPSKRKAR
jgi:polyphosphate glucokinase